MRAIQLHFYSDPSHGWLKVPRKMLEELNVLDSISSASYMRGEHVYLEEDEDCDTFFNTIKNNYGEDLVVGFKKKLKYHYTENSSKIRNYSFYKM